VELLAVRPRLRLSIFVLKLAKSDYGGLVLEDSSLRTRAC